MAGHLEADLVSSTAVLEEIKTCGGVSLAGDLVAVPRGAPEIAGHDVGEELEVSDGKGLEVRRRGTGDKFIVGKIENADTWKALVNGKVKPLFRRHVNITELYIVIC